MLVKAVFLAVVALAVAQENYPPQPYSFNFDSTDEFGTRLFQSESGDEGNRKTGSYGYVDASGVQRTVNYVADENGFRATVDTNEPGTKAESPADVQLNANPLPNPEVGAKPVAAAVHTVHAVHAAPAFHAVHAVPVTLAHAPLTYTLGRAKSR
ncbi:cuticle protein 10.9-like [Ornithodoros turicata]|uniref:cuticle protein 10.9-like n=1 Tax=Ornithodoros turicata TaxID=34597 RepID=UPI0031396AF3